MFIDNDGSLTLFLLVYVDDILLTGNSTTLFDKFIVSLAQRFSLKDLGALHFFLGVEAFPTANGLFLSQQKYICDLLHRTNMLESKEVSHPMSSSEQLKLQDGTPLQMPLSIVKEWVLAILVLDTSGYLF